MSYIEYSVIKSDVIKSFDCSPLRTYATKYFPLKNLFNTLHTVFVHGLSFFIIIAYRSCLPGVP